jgi:putative flippase GtrA
MNQALLRLNRLRDVTLLRYIAASALALAVDVGAFMILLALGAAAAPAAAAGYALGIVAHWLISSRKVFAESVAVAGPGRARQKAMFVLSALIGLGLTTLIVGGAAMAGMDPRLAKLAAIFASFTVTWLLRSRMIFVECSGQ